MPGGGKQDQLEVFLGGFRHDLFMRRSHADVVPDQQTMMKEDHGQFTQRRFTGGAQFLVNAGQWQRNIQIDHVKQGDLDGRLHCEGVDEPQCVPGMVRFVQIHRHEN